MIGILVELMTGIWGGMFATAFAKTKSLYLPVGLHLGWNFISTVVFSQGPLGHQLLISAGRHQLQGFLSLLMFLFQVFALPLLTYFYLKRYSQRHQFYADKEQQPLQNDVINL